MAPPLSLSLSGSRPSCLPTATACAAKASLASTRSRSLTVQPAFFKAACEAVTGPIPMIAGSTPVVAHDTILANGLMPRFLASSALISTSAAAPSLMPEALPAGTEPSLGDAWRRLPSVRVARELVGVAHDVALAGLHRDRNDLILEAAGLLRRLGLVLRRSREGILLGAGDLVFLRHVLGGVAHVVAVEGVPQTVLQHGVGHLELAHLGAVAHVRGVRRLAHALLTADHHDRGVAVPDRLPTEGDGT